MLFFASKALAQQSNIIPDNTLGAESSGINRNVTINGVNADSIDKGARRGGNLFHSFSEFNINDGQNVYFANPAGVENILTRVTGGNASNIFGTLGVDGSANLFLINPSGIVFGENARLDVQGSFLGTTANGVQFGEQGTFSATNPQAPGLLTVNPSALFFNQITASGGIINKSQAPAGINPEGNQTTGLRVPDGKSLLFVGGNINLDGGSLRAYEGSIELASVAAPGNIGLDISGDTFSLNVPDNVERGDIVIANESFISVFGAVGGNFVINARNLQISNSSIYAGTDKKVGNPDAQSGDVILNATGSILLQDGAFIDNSVYSQGNAGNININAGSVSLIESSKLDTRTFGQGNAGNIQLNTGTLSVTNGTLISSSSSQGDAGNITINAGDTVTFDNRSNASSSIFADAVGNAGDIQITTKSLSVTNGAQISASTYGLGNAGNIFLDVSDTITVDGFDAKSESTSKIFTTGGSNSVGNGGDVRIITNELLLKNGGDISTFNTGQGNGGNIFLDVRNKITFDGVDSSNLLPSSAQTFAVNGNAGNIEVKTGSLFLTNAGTMSTIGLPEKNSNNIANAGNITINARDTIKLDGANSHLTTSLNRNSGKGGDIQITTGSLFVTNGASLFATTNGRGNAGNISINARDTISFHQGGFVATAVLSDGIGNGGGINITTNSLSVTNGSILRTITSGQGDAGNIIIDADTITFEQRSSANTTVNSNGIGDAGDIRIKTGKFSITNDSRLVSSTFGQGNAGDIEINADETIIIQGGYSGFFSTAKSKAKGNGGTIRVTTNALFLEDNGLISTDTRGKGNAGKITINANTFAATNGGLILSTTNSSGNAGTINLNIIDSITLSGTNNSVSGLFANTSPNSTGKGGSIFIIDPRLVTIENRARVSVSSDGTGGAGDITLQAGTLKLDNGIISAQTASTLGGNITLEIGELLLLRNESPISTTAGTALKGGNGGNITVNAKFIVALANEDNNITANAFLGNGGKVLINSRGIFGIESRSQPTGKSDITASSQRGIAGETNVNTDDTSSIENSFTQLSPNIDTDAIIANSCIVRGNQQQKNSFYITGSGALPPNRPGNSFVSNYITGEVRGVETKPRPWKKGDPIIEPQGLYRLNNGQLLLSRECSN